MFLTTIRLTCTSFITQMGDAAEADHLYLDVYGLFQQRILLRVDRRVERWKLQIGTLQRRSSR